MGKLLPYITSISSQERAVVLWLEELLALQASSVEVGLFDVLE